MTFCSAEYKKFPITELKNLSTHEMYHRRSNFVYISTIPFFYRIAVKPVKILMVPLTKKSCKRTIFQPVHPMLLMFIFFKAIPYSAKITADNDIIIFCHFILFRENFSIEPGKISVTVTGYINHPYCSSLIKYFTGTSFVNHTPFFDKKNEYPSSYISFVFTI